MRTDAKKPKSLSWFEPAWSFRPRLRQELAGIMHLWMWVRIFIVTLLLVALLQYFVNRAVPNLQFDWARSFIFACGWLGLSLAAFTAILWCFAPMVSVNAKGVSRQEGQHVVWRLRADIRCIILDRTAPDRPRLCVEVPGKRPLDCGIDSKIGLDSLAAFLRETFPDQVTLAPPL